MTPSLWYHRKIHVFFFEGVESQIFPKRISIKYLSSPYVLALQVAMSTKYETYRKTLFPKSTNGELSNNLPIALVIEKKKTTRWDPTRYKWSYNPYKYRVITPVTHLFSATCRDTSQMGLPDDSAPPSFRRMTQKTAKSAPIWGFSQRCAACLYSLVEGNYHLLQVTYFFFWGGGHSRKAIPFW